MFHPIATYLDVIIIIIVHVFFCVSLTEAQTVEHDLYETTTDSATQSPTELSPLSLPDYKVEVISRNRYDLGEGPFWEEREDKLYFVDAFVGDFVKLDPKTGRDEKISFKELVTIIIPFKDEPKQFIVTKYDKWYKLNWTSKSLQYLGAAEKGTRFNDGKCDARGRLWTGTVGADAGKTGTLYSMGSDLKVIPRAGNFSLSNGMTWSLNNKKMFFVDSIKRQVYVFDYDLNMGSVANQSVLLDYNNNPYFGDNEVPDGMTIDRRGYLWVACFNGGRIIRVDPETGDVMEEIKLPATKITSLCFGGKYLDTLYVTSAFGGLSDAQRKEQPDAGAIFKITFNSVRVRGYFGQRFVKNEETLAESNLSICNLD